MPQPLSTSCAHMSEPFLSQRIFLLRTDLVKTYLHLFAWLFLLHIYLFMYVKCISLYVLFDLMRCSIRFIPTGMRRQPLLRTSCAASIERFTLSCFLSLVSFLLYASWSSSKTVISWYSAQKSRAAYWLLQYTCWEIDRISTKWLTSSNTTDVK